MIINVNEEMYSYLLKQVEKQELLPNGTREILNAYAVFEPTTKLKRAKQGYCDAELAWYKSCERNIKGHPKIEDNPIWQNCAADDGSVNSNYGWCVFSEENHKQLEHAIENLKQDRWSRQSSCVYIRPEIQIQHNDNVHAKHDFICTFCTHHFIRDNKLDYIVYMRSNDIEYGLPYDLYWHQYVYDIIFRSLRETYKDLSMGHIHWHASSLHKYEKEQKAGASVAG